MNIPSHAHEGQETDTTLHQYLLFLLLFFDDCHRGISDAQYNRSPVLFACRGHEAVYGAIYDVHTYRSRHRRHPQIVHMKLLHQLGLWHGKLLQGYVGAVLGGAASCSLGTFPLSHDLGTDFVETCGDGCGRGITSEHVALQHPCVFVSGHIGKIPFYKQASSTRYRQLLLCLVSSFATVTLLQPLRSSTPG